MEEIKARKPAGSGRDIEKHKATQRAWYQRNKERLNRERALRYKPVDKEASIAARKISAGAYRERVMAAKERREAREGLLVHLETIIQYLGIDMLLEAIQGAPNERKIKKMIEI